MARTSVGAAGAMKNQSCSKKASAITPSKVVIDLSTRATSLKSIFANVADIEQPVPNAVTSDMCVRSVHVPSAVPVTWLDPSLPYVAIYNELNAPFSPTLPAATFYTITESGHAALEHATEDLHSMFVRATEYVLENEADVGKYFHIPDVLWPKIRRSWAQSKHDVVSGRFDFALTNEGIKVYEYNADSASCLLECGYVQDAWAAAAGVTNVGRSTSATLFQQLVQTWKDLKISGPLHIMCDRDIEERYHATYMQAAAEAAGIRCYLVVGIDGITWTLDNQGLQDGAGHRIVNVWKTWCWRTVMNEVEAREEATASFQVPDAPQLMDILLHESVRVFEPLWTLLAGSKAILPILSKLFPHSPYLLKSSFDERDVAEFTTGYVAKPVMGRTGSNISLYSADRQLLNETGGRWVRDTIVYQELAMLPKYNDAMYVQVNTWAIHGAFGGTVLRQDASSIIGLNSDIPLLRVVPDADDNN
ncbi:hypothetical protein H310_12070 [Aphanomyces invadans]|uniref:Glutathionylspermidine synthase pre-ATP-grasp-like domain-containing protein n=1 Tax=Aphanomyces invadans TaxID=157072 RepID=A0A024TL12_9STRA|nr:hypothetical protein H310_12070 [Aphanomyces invadans]ETV94022.1 hypothetical protein H310_12070 [Aphanomyces invadans]|eukprot:XP_008877225.1 hypothetical protein H310_12070 [Aphanomyces invadans]